jgi:hypothetical protein
VPISEELAWNRSDVVLNLCATAVLVFREARGIDIGEIDSEVGEL